MVNLPIIILVSISGVMLTRYVIEGRKLSPIRAACLLTLSFVAFTNYINSPIVPILQAGFLGATFVGMTESERMPLSRLVFASVVFSLIFYFLIPHSRGLGGALGCGAFLACLFTQGIYKILYLLKASSK